MHDERVTIDLMKMDSTVLPFLGLQNMGNTCYLNSVLQVLLFCPDFVLKLAQTKLIVGKEDHGCDDLKVKCSKLNVMKELSYLLSNLTKKRFSVKNHMHHDEEITNMNEKYVRPEKFVESFRKAYPMFEPYTQQDAQECLHCILDACGSAAETAVKEIEKLSEVAEVGYRMYGGRKSSCATLVTSNTAENHKHSSGNSKTVLSPNKTASNKIVSQTSGLINLKTPFDERNDRVIEKSPNVGCFGQIKNKRKKLASTELLASSADKENKENGDVSHTNNSVPTPPPKKIRVGTAKPPNHADLRRALLRNRLGWSKKKQKFDFEKKSNSLPTRPVLSDPQNDDLVDEQFFASSSSTAQPSTNCREILSVSEDTRPAVHVTPAPNSFEAKDAVISVEVDGKTNFIEELFQGELETTVRCAECENGVQRSETFQDISLPVHEPKPVNRTTHTAAERDCTEDDPGDGTLSSALSEFTSPEILDGENKYFCNICRRLSDGEQRMKFKRLPPVLAFHLKRFAASVDTTLSFGASVAKITSTLEIPDSLTLKDWCSDECSHKDATYSLFGVIVHNGITITGGHYSSYVKYQCSADGAEAVDLKKYNGQWLEMDDEDVRLLRSDDIQKVLKGQFELSSKSPYLLFYHRQH